MTDLSFGGAVRDGMWLLVQLRGRREFARTRVLAVTGRDFAAGWRDQHPFDAVLFKPIDPQHLCDLIARLGINPAVRSVVVRCQTVRPLPPREVGD
jgi:hypothetical protein